MAEQDVEGEWVLVQVAIQHELSVHVAGLFRLEDRGVSFFVQNCQEQPNTQKHQPFQDYNLLDLRIMPIAYQLS